MSGPHWCGTGQHRGHRESVAEFSWEQPVSSAGADTADVTEDGACQWHSTIAERGESESDEGSDSWRNGDDENDWPGCMSGSQVIFHDLILSPGQGCGGVSISGGPASAGYGERPRFTLLFFHSCSGSPEDVLYYVPSLFSSAGMRPGSVRVVAPCSPRRRCSDGWEYNAWHEYVTDRCWLGRDPDRVSWEQFAEQRQRLLAVLEEEHERLPPGGRIVLGGLSQGAALAIDVMLHAPLHIDSIVGCFCARGMMQHETLWDLPQQKIQLRARSCSVFVFHGRRDDVVPWSAARRSYQWLQAQCFDVCLRTEKWSSHASDCAREYREVAQFVASSWNRSAAV